MEILTLEKLPEAFSAFTKDVNEKFKLLLEKTGKQASLEDRWFDIKGLSDYLPDHPAKATIYSWVSKEKIPFDKGSKKLQFLKSRIDAWLLAGRPSNDKDRVANAHSILVKKKGNNS